MTGLGIYKLDNGESYASNCFPIRSFYHSSNEGAGHWLVAYRNTMEERISKKKSALGSHFEVPSERRRPESPNKVLDAQFLITLHCVDQPTDLCSVNICDQGLQTVRLEGLEEFDNVAYINASDNRLTLEPFSRFPALRKLELSLNGLHTLEIRAEDFQSLEILDLSFNSITGESILNLGLLSHLKMLHLTGNQLQMLPHNMAGSCTCPEESAHQCVVLFQSLEVLMVDDNRLTSPGVFMSLANLKRLQHLNLQGNYISGVPFLEQREPLHDSQISNIPDSFKQRPENTLSVQEDTMDGKRTKDAPKNVSQQKATTRTSNRKDPGYREDFFPFPELRHLNLANNEITEQEALLPVALFPKLNELVIHSNPLTTQRCGDPPMLTSFLQDRLGINIKRKKTTDLAKPHMRLPVSPKRKVKTKIPKIPLIMANRHTEQLNAEKHLPPECELNPAFGASSQTSIEEEEDIAMGHDCFDMASADISFQNLNAEPFFVTEVDGLHESDYQEDNLKMKKDSEVFPEKLTGYEILFEETSEAEMSESLGIQHAVRALEQTLDNLLVYRDSKANLDRPQKPYTARERKITNLPPLRPKKSKGEKVEEILSQLKEMKTISRVPLDNVLNRGNESKTEYEKALTLLKDMQRRYKMIHLKTVEQATQLETEKIGGLN